MAAWSHSAFLQALGWATLNSFWQMALLWCVFSVANHLFRLSSATKYNMAVTAITGGFAWFVFTFLTFGHQAPSYPLAFTVAAVPHPFLDTLVTSASVTYLCLLCVPAYRLLKNWQHIQRLRKQHLHKAELGCRLFVKKVASRLGIKKPVQVYLSDLVKSPLTIGYLKPIILLPMAAMSRLNTQQVEAVLLHELSHIKRYDYLVNVIVTIIYTLLYFNPFMKLFLRIMDAERENCCDELVLQFEYDKLSYASALLALEKNAQALIMAAANKKHLLNRIEKIVGMERKPAFKMNQVIGIFAAFLFVCLVNAVLIVGKEEKTGNTDLSFTQIANPFYFINPENNSSEDVQWQSEKARTFQAIAQTEAKPVTVEAAAATAHKVMAAKEPAPPPPPPVPITDQSDQVIPVNFNLADAALDNTEKQQVQQTVTATKKILATIEWQKVENAIADAMTAQEKQLARQQYLNEVEKINWKQLENKLKAGYNHIDWDNVNGKINNALTVIKLDSLQSVYQHVIEQANKAKVDSEACILAYPDVTVNQLDTIRNEAQKRLHVIQVIKNKKVVRL